MSAEMPARIGKPFKGEVEVPGDKSISHRALMLAGLAAGRSVLSGLNPGEDCARTRAALEQLGAVYVRDSRGWVVTGVGESGMPAAIKVDCGNSGTTLRILAGALAGYPLEATYFGDASLSRRPVARVVAPLRLMGARVEAHDGDRLPPLTVRGGGLHGIVHRSPVASAQVKSCVLMAGVRAGGETAVEEPRLSRDHTERLLPHFGVGVERRGEAIVVRGGSRLGAADFAVPGDPSAAVYWALAAALIPGSDVIIPDLCLNPTRIGALLALQRMGADLTMEVKESSVEPRGTLRIRGGAALRGIEIAAADIPSLVDELPALAVAQAFAGGESRVSGAGELRLKESDRIETTAAALRLLGVEVETAADGWRIQGRSGDPFRGGRIEAHGDHRIAMSFSIAGLASTTGVSVDDTECVLTSDPQFLDSLRRFQA